MSTCILLAGSDTGSMEGMTYETIAPLSAAELAENSLKTPERGYPPIEGRLHLPPELWRQMVQGNEIQIPDGPWHITDHGNRQKAPAQARLDAIATDEKPMAAERIDYWQRLGLLVDTAGRPLHPRAEQLLTSPIAGMFTGPGFHYKYGPQRMGNLGFRRERRGTAQYAMSAVQRSTIKWGMPGGYANPNETVEDAAFREASEEVGLERTALGALSVRRAVLSPPKGFKRDTLHAWGEEWFTFAQCRHDASLDGIELAARDQEVVAVAWVGLDDVELSLQGASQYDIMGTHAKMILENERHIQLASGI